MKISDSTIAELRALEDERLAERHREDAHRIDEQRHKLEGKALAAESALSQAAAYLRDLRSDRIHDEALEGEAGDDVLFHLERAAQHARSALAVVTHLERPGL